MLADMIMEKYNTRVWGKAGNKYGVFYDPAFSQNKEIDEIESTKMFMKGVVQNMVNRSRPNANLVDFLMME